MKKILKIIPILLLVFAFGCDGDDDGARFANDPTTGWVEFSTPTSGRTISIITEEVILPVSIRVPVYEDGITVNYSIVPVQGDFSSILTTEGSSIFVPAGRNGPDGNTNLGFITLNFANVADLTEIVVFDVVLTGTDINGVNVGLGENSITSYRISTPCPIDINGLAGTYSVQENFTDGVNAPLGLTDFFGESYQLELSVNPDDLTQTQLIVNNSPGFDTYINNGTIITFDTCNGTVSYSQTPLQLALFSTLDITASSYSEDTFVITSSGAFGAFGPYQFTLTKL